MISRSLVWIALVGTAIAAVGTALIFAWPGSEPVTGARFNLGPEGQYGLVTQVAEGRFYLVRSSGDEEFIVLSWVSPHRGCTVPWRDNFEFNGRTGWFRDPCSSSTFDREGGRVFGPAPRDMDRYPVSIVDGDVIVDTTSYVCGYAPPGERCVEPAIEP